MDNGRFFGVECGEGFSYLREAHRRTAFALRP